VWTEIPDKPLMNYDDEEEDVSLNDSVLSISNADDFQSQSEISESPEGKRTHEIEKELTEIKFDGTVDI